MKRNIVFLTGTRADFGKLKSLIEITLREPEFETHIFATGMHLNSKYGRTVDEIQKCGYPNIYCFINHHDFDSMDTILAKTIQGLSSYVTDLKPDLIIIHGDRVEALAGAIVGALNNILVLHIEGGEVSGTVDELVRHAVSKMSHVHFVANEEAKTRLIQMGEMPASVFVVGSPDVDVMLSDNLPELTTVLKHYDITFRDYAVVMFHPVTTEIDDIQNQADTLVQSLVESGKNYIVVFPNNDMGSHYILDAYKKLNGRKEFAIFPSIRFEYFLVLLKNAQFIIGNSSAGIREAPYYGVPTINLGSRQNNRSVNPDIINGDFSKNDILNAIKKTDNFKPKKLNHFGAGNSDELFINELRKKSFWEIPKQKVFVDLTTFPQ